MSCWRPIAGAATIRSNAGAFVYLVGFERGLRDAISEGRLPDHVRRALAGRVCEMNRLPPESIPGAVVTPDGAWHDLQDHGWRMVGERVPMARLCLDGRRVSVS